MASIFRRIHLFLHADRGFQRFFHIYWAIGCFRCARKFSSSESRRGDTRFSPHALPTFLDRYRGAGMPSLEGRGLKAASDEHGGRANPDSQERIPTAEATAHARKYVADRFPALKDAPIVETRICQYENTSSGDFLIDRHPDFENVWLVGGGSGHGFKHGPALGEYVTERINQGGEVEPRFSLPPSRQSKRAPFTDAL